MCPLFSQYVSKTSAVVVVVVVLKIDSIFDVFDAPPPSSSSSVVVLFDHFCAENLRRVFENFCRARVASKNQCVPLFLCTRESEHATGESIYLHVSSSILNALCVMRSGDVCCCLCDVLQKYERKVSAELRASCRSRGEQKAPVPLLCARESERAGESISVFLLQFYVLCVMRSGDVCCLMRCSSYVFGKYSQNCVSETFLNALGYSSNTRVLREQKSDAFYLLVDRSLSTHFLEKRFVLLRG